MLHKNKSNDSIVDLDEVNKYVGYKSKTLRVTLTETSGYLKKLVNEVSMMQKSLFPQRYYVYRRDTGELRILNKPHGTVKHTFQANEITYVRVSDIMECEKTDKKLK